MRAMSTRTDDPNTPRRPFDKDRDGFVMGEGGASSCWKNGTREKARAREFIAKSRVTATPADAAPHHSPRRREGAWRCMKMALRPRLEYRGHFLLQRPGTSSRK